ncbi:hypothetical protein B9G98_03039 [Wickerhamiella sorbophila]|uniref:Uncharacterized protein n=1 Tax=Wickerhamiella sorbophila TaxID=45607 RepID=A0A2T0FKB7_9ASCO|nr:hypothetical protein B9G98_03039 [Wickerhamiella sorbophila]PRT55419.1 hypothetical protein B9G98_03039 [Wickerhamiella sorbophila]
MSKRDRRTLEPIKTISVFSTGTLDRVHKLDFSHPRHRFDEIDWSRPSDFSLRALHSRPPQRIAEPLAATYLETEMKRPEFAASKLKSTIPNRNVADIDPISIITSQQPRPLLVLGSTPLAEIPQNLSEYKTMNNAKTASQMPAQILATPHKRAREAPIFESAMKRRAPGGSAFETPRKSADVSFTDADDSFSRVSTEQLLRMVDSGLVDTPEPSASPRVRSAAPGPSPKVSSLVYAYTTAGRENSRMWTRQPNPWQVENMPPPTWRPR